MSTKISSTGRFFPGRSAASVVGERVRLVGEAQRWRTLVGVVRHIRHAALDEQPRPEVYVPFEQTDPAWQLEVRHHGHRDARIGGSAGPGRRSTALSNIRTLAGALSASVAPRVFNLRLLGAFAATPWCCA